MAPGDVAGGIDETGFLSRVKAGPGNVSLDSMLTEIDYPGDPDLDAVNVKGRRFGARCARSSIPTTVRFGFVRVGR